MPTVLFVLVIAGCTPAVRPLAPIAFHFEIQDNPSARGFDLVLQSRHDRALCVERDAWPMSGTLLLANEDVYLETASGRLPLLAPFASVYCPGGCGEIRIDAGHTLSGRLSYGAFGSMERIERDPSRRLHFSVYPYECHR